MRKFDLLFCSWQGRAKTLPGLMEEMAIEVYERGYIELPDVLLLQEWIQALLAHGYEFPDLIETGPRVE